MEEEEVVVAKDNAAREEKTRRCNRSHAPIRFTRRFTAAVAGPVFMMRMSAPVVTLATVESPATPRGGERESVLWRADSLTHTFPGISYSQVIYDAYIALGERRTAASHSIPTRSYIHVVAYFQMPGRPLSPCLPSPFLGALFRVARERRRRARAGRFGFWTRASPFGYPLFLPLLPPPRPSKDFYISQFLRVITLPTIS